MEEKQPHRAPEHPDAGDIARALYALAFEPDGGAGAPKAADRLRALELLGKHLGMFSGETGAAAHGEVTILDDIR